MASQGEEPVKEYRQNAHAASLIAWAILCFAVAFVLFAHSARLVDREWRLAEILGGVALLIFGPAALAVYLVRAETIRVAVKPDRGILIRGRTLIPWEEIERVERRKPRLRKGTGPAEVPKMGKDAGVWSGCADPGCFIGFGEGGLIVAGILMLACAVLVVFWLLLFVFVPLLVVPVIEVFSPWGDRVTIVAKRGKVLLRDLRDADGFLSEIGSRVPVRER